MPLLIILSDALAWLGRKSARAVALSMVLALAIPPLGAVAKELMVPLILGLLVLSFVRTDVRSAFGGGRGAVAGGAVAWIVLALPFALGLLIGRTGEPGALTLAVLMQACSPPVMSAPAFALLLGLDARLVLAAMVGAMAAVPFTAPALIAHFSHGALAIDPFALGLRLAAVVGGTALAGTVLRRLASPARIARWGAHLDGLNVLLLGGMAFGLLDGVTLAFIADPLFMAGLVALASTLSVVGIAVTMLVFRAIDPGDALTLGFAAGHRNMSVMIAATGALLPQETWLYVGAAQFPIYLLPMLLMPVARRLKRTPGAT